MSSSNQLKALLRKNLILWRRNICGSVCELMFPFAMMAVLILLRSVIPSEDHDQTSYIDHENSYFLGPEQLFFSRFDPINIQPYVPNPDHSLSFEACQKILWLYWDKLLLCLYPN